MPTLPSQVQAVVTAPSGGQHEVRGQANEIGYFYDPTTDFAVDEPGVWIVDVRVWHDSRIGSGEQVNCDPADPFNVTLPCPSGDVLGGESGSYTFYVVPPATPALPITTPTNGFLTFGHEVTPVSIRGLIPAGVENASVTYTIRMPGFILAQGGATVSDNSFEFVFDPVALNADFPNLDLRGREDWVPGLLDTISISVLLQGESESSAVYQAQTITLQGQEVLVGEQASPFGEHIYLPSVRKGG